MRPPAASLQKKIMQECHDKKSVCLNFIGFCVADSSILPGQLVYRNVPQIAFRNYGVPEFVLSNLNGF
jgi:hypothetical protein